MKSGRKKIRETKFQLRERERERGKRPFSETKCYNNNDQTKNVNKLKTTEAT